jgi:ABC-2 type transport system permease protein
MSERGSTSALRTGIYDLGYRHYEGARLGRLYAVWSLAVYSFRGVFGLGRSWVAKVFSMGLAVIALIPALILMGVAAIVPEDVNLALNYFDFVGFGFVGIVLALFSAVTAPELIGRDQRHHTLALYFSRSLSRADYVSAKLAALTAGVTLVIMVPQVILFFGNAIATETIADYLIDNLADLPPILGSSLLIGTMMSSLTLAMAAQTPRRAWATGAVIVYFVVASALGAILLELMSGDGAGYVLLVSPFATLQGAVYWLFGDPLPVASDAAKADLDGAYYLLAALGYTVLSLGLLYRRFTRMAV